MNGPKRVSLRDIAHAAGVGRTTVSLALRNDPRLPLATRQRIQQVAQRLGYTPNPLVSTIMATHRVTEGAGHLGTLGFLTTFPTREGWRNWTAQRYYAGAVARARQLGYQLETFWLKEPGMTGRRMTTTLRTRGVEGLIIAPTPRAVSHVSLGWPNFAAAALGYTTRRPALHRAAHYHFDGLTTALRQLKRLGYRRIGLALATQFDERVQRLWRASFLVYQDRGRTSDFVPVLLMKSLDGREFTRWFDRYRPDVVIGSDLVIPDWLRNRGLDLPGDVGFAHLDLPPQQSRLAGIDQNSDLVGAAAVDLVVNQLHRGERGIPHHPEVVLIEGCWVNGDTVRGPKQSVPPSSLRRT